MIEVSSVDDSPAGEAARIDDDRVIEPSPRGIIGRTVSVRLVGDQRAPSKGARR